MLRFIEFGYNQTVLLLVAFENQILPGTFAHTILSRVGNKIDLGLFGSPF